MSRIVSERERGAHASAAARRQRGRDRFATQDRGDISEEDIYFLREGTHARLYQVLGARPTPAEEGGGTRFAVWAPNAGSVSVIGEFNGWRPGVDALERRADGSAIWEGFVREAEPGALYKYRIDVLSRGFSADRGDPFARSWESPPGSASRVWRADHTWSDNRWMQERALHNAPGAPLAMYEVHLGSWRRVVLEGGGTRFLTYREAAEALAGYVSELGFTHVELLPVMEHTDYESLGYATSGYFAPTARYGGPDDFMYFIDRLHQRGIGVILDWVPFHFAADAEGLADYDGSTLFQHGDRVPMPACGQGLAFDCARPEVRSFLLSVALYWLDRYHVDGLRLARLPKMLERGGNEPTQVADLVREINAAVRREYPDTLCIAGGPLPTGEPAGRTEARFALEWDRDWVRDTLGYFEQDPYRRLPRQTALSYQVRPSVAKGVVLALSHDEMAAGSNSLIGRMAGDDWQRRAHLRLLLGFQYACPGKKLLFMGGEFGQLEAWRPPFSLDWHLLERAGHRGLKTWMRDLNRLYRRTPALFQRDADHAAIAAMDVQQGADGVIAFLRQGSAPSELVLVACNLMPHLWRDCRIGVPKGGWWNEELNSDAWMYGGSGQGNLGGVDADPVPTGEQYNSLLLTLPPLGILFLRHLIRPREN